MREQWRERLNTEITRGQFLRYMGGALLMVFGLDNLLSLLAGSNRLNVPTPAPQPLPDQAAGFGTRKFGR